MGREKVNVSKITSWELGQIFLQGDGRYSLVDIETIYNLFLLGALLLEKQTLPNIEVNDSELSQIPGPQKVMKLIAKKILESEGWIVEFEVDIGWGRVDVLAKKNETQIAVECGPCRLSKLKQYFKIRGLEELWVVSHYSDDNTLFVVKRGEAWNVEIEKLDVKLEKELRKIKSPLDNF